MRRCAQDSLLTDQGLGQMVTFLGWVASAAHSLLIHIVSCSALCQLLTLWHHVVVQKQKHISRGVRSVLHVSVICQCAGSDVQHTHQNSHQTPFYENDER